MKDLGTQLGVTFVYILVTFWLLGPSWGQDGPQIPPGSLRDRFWIDFWWILHPKWGVERFRFFIHFRCWSPLGAKMGPRPLQEASRIDVGSILNGFYTNFGQILDDFWSDFGWFFNDFGDVSYYFGHQPNQAMNDTIHQSINKSPYIPMHTARPINHSVT